MLKNFLQQVVKSSVVATILFAIHAAVITAHAQDELPVVRAALFYSPTCGHCRIVIEETLPPLLKQYGSQLEIIGVDITQPQGQALFLSAIQWFNLDSAGVPFLVVGNEYMIGSVDIPQKFPALIESYLAEGGVDWPDVPGLKDAIYASQTASAPTQTIISPTLSSASIPTDTPAPVIPETDSSSEAPLSLPHEIEMTAWQRVMLDPLGNGIAIAVLIGMIGVLAWVIMTFNNPRHSPVSTISDFMIPILSIIGLGIAGYLAYVETTQTTAVCGPVGDCNTVQQSEFAYLFGILPVGVLGVIGYLFILSNWIVGKTQNEPVASLGRLVAFTSSGLGILFSIYLTFLEPFVIGATCAWCIASAIIMTALFIVTFPDGRRAYLKLSSR